MTRSLYNIFRVWIVLISCQVSALARGQLPRKIPVFRTTNDSADYALSKLQLQQIHASEKPGNASNSDRSDTPMPGLRSYAADGLLHPGAGPQALSSTPDDRRTR